MAQLLALHLSDLQHNVDISANGLEGLSKLENNAYDLLILDIMLPGMDGLEVCKKLRARENHIPVLMLTAKSSELDRVVGLEIGADDYVSKPFSISEVLARVKAILRRREFDQSHFPAQDQDMIQRGGLKIDLSKHEVTIDNQIIELTAREFDLLVYFAKQPGRVYSRTQLLDQVWGYGHDGYEHTVNSHINRLRMKIEKNPGEPVYIKTVWGVGYKFSELQQGRDHG